MLSDTVSDLLHSKPATGPDACGQPVADHRHLADLFEDAARRHAGRIAAVEPGFAPMTYRELEHRSGALARRLAGAGIGRGAFVALCAGRSIQALVAILAIVRTGAAYVPLDPAYPDAQLAHMLADAAPAILLADAAMQPRLAGMGHGATLWLLDEAGHEANGPAPDRTLCQPGDAAYVMYTSGSTGKPKGVVVPHRGVARLVVGQDYCDLGAQEVILHLAPLAFDASTFEIWGALLHGGCLAIVPQGQASLDSIADVLKGQQVTTAWLTAGLFHLMVDRRIEALAGLTQLLAGGDVLSPDHVARFLAAVPNCRLINGYGPTENTTFTCCATIDRATWSGGRVPIGRAIAGTQVFIVDEALRPVVPGEQGQLAAAGDGLALGYLGQAALTAERFVEAPAPISQRLYLTGDLVRALPDGSLDFLGRIDRQVKIDGKRVEPGEIEAALRLGEEVADACVVIDGKRILAFIAVGCGQGDAVVEAAAARLRQQLPAHMCPARIVPVAAFPLTPNGKVDRAALLRLIAENAEPVIGTDDLQGRILAIWQQVLGTAQIGLDQAFFDLGGTSLQWMRVHAELEHLLRVKIAITDLFARPTIRAMTAHLGGAPQAAPQSLSDAARERARRQRGAALRRARAS
ncbi:non-ribosomal peptide synthetase [Novosphingobium terrae]|uniref:non-ribosomal peptide synthetase n=1 Tax=Novosphingobium terrae TaxID=2726189 RepID=UPI00197FA3DE|nr:non-ribosomal peptide synthetase [Novosphingobium terrae]